MSTALFFVAGGIAEQRSDLALYDRLRKEAEDDRASSDDDASITNAVVPSGTGSVEETYRGRSPSSGVHPVRKHLIGLFLFFEHFPRGEKHQPHDEQWLRQPLERAETAAFLCRKRDEEGTEWCRGDESRPPDHHRIPERLKV